MRKRNSVTLGLALAASWLLAGTASATAAEDAALKGRIEARLGAAAFHQPAEIQVQVEQGKAVLMGSVPTVRDQWTARAAARKEVRDVEDRIQVVPRTNVSDATLQTAVEHAVLTYPYYDVFDAVGFTVEKGAVKLTGSVYQPNRKNDIEDRVARIPGIRQLTSEVRVQPASFFDDNLRWQCYRVIYGNTSFSHYAIAPDPPVRIIVENGKITLMGSVATAFDRNLLTILASGVGSFGPVKNEVRVEGEGKAPAHPKPSRDIIV
jgi:osmotically-inducible protein OsmY